MASGGILSTTSTTGAQPAYLETPITNQTGGKVTIGSVDTRHDDGTLTTNSGTFSVASGDDLALSGNSSFTQSAGTLKVTGAMSESSGTFTQSGGTESGNPVQLSSTTLADSTGAGSFDVVGSSTLTGSIPTGQTVTVDGSITNVNLAFRPRRPTPARSPSSRSAGYAGIEGSGGITVASGGILSTTSTTGAQPAYLETPITNQTGGKVTIGSANTHQDEGTVTANSGTFTVASGDDLALSGNSSFTQSAGTLKVTGAMSESSGTFTQSGGTESGNPVQLSNTTLADSTGAGSFDVVGSSTLTGSIPTGQTVTVDGSGSNVASNVSSTVRPRDPRPQAFGGVRRHRRLRRNHRGLGRRPVHHCGVRLPARVPRDTDHQPVGRHDDHRLGQHSPG